MKRAPELSRVSEVADSTARVLSMSYWHRGAEYQADFAHGPSLLWEPSQEFYLWITPKPKKVGCSRASQHTEAAAAFERWAGEPAGREIDFLLPASPLARKGRAGRIVYRFERDGDRYWHHDWDAADCFYMGNNATGPRVFAVTGPKLMFTAHGIIN